MMGDKLIKNEHFLDLLLVLIDLKVIAHQDVTAMEANKNSNMWMSLMSRAIWQAHNHGYNSLKDTENDVWE